MLTKRQQDIMLICREIDFTSIKDLVNKLGVSESAIRRDVQVLLKGNELTKNGKYLLVNDNKIDLTMDNKMTLNTKDKDAIGLMAANLVEDGDVIFIGGGSTTLTMIKHLANKDIFVVTNSLHHAAELATHNIRCWVTGGSLDPKTGALLGHLALESFANKMFTKSFLGLNGVKNGKLMTTNIREAKLKRMVIEKSEKAYVLFDKSKVGKISVEIFADENEVETIS